MWFRQNELVFSSRMHRFIQGLFINYIIKTSTSTDFEGYADSNLFPGSFISPSQRGQEKKAPFGVGR